jgi:serine/threonine-protein kinase
VPDVAPGLPAPTTSAPNGDGAGDAPADQTIVPGPYTAPMSIRAAARFAEVASGGAAHHGVGRRTPGNRLAVVVLVGVALLAAGSVGTALAFRFGARRARAGAEPPSPTEAPPSTPAP